MLSDTDFREKLSTLDLDDVCRFIGISAFVYSMDFARWLMQLKPPATFSSFVQEFPSPSITSMKAACDSICGLPYLESLYQEHLFTSITEAPGRCFDVCYVSEILSLLLVGRHDERIVNFLLEV